MIPLIVFYSPMTCTLDEPNQRKFTQIRSILQGVTF